VKPLISGLVTSDQMPHERGGSVHFKNTEEPARNAFGNKSGLPASWQFAVPWSESTKRRSGRATKKEAGRTTLWGYPTQQSHAFLIARESSCVS
jgi:hypothetical protein